MSTKETIKSPDTDNMDFDFIMDIEESIEELGIMVNSVNESVKKRLNISQSELDVLVEAY